MARNIKFIKTSHKAEFSGDIVITDPGYICDNYADIPDSKIIYRDTLYGDWGCTVFDTTKTRNKCLGKNILSTFTADGGDVCCILLKDAKKYGDAVFKKMLKEGSVCISVIKNFKGVVKFNVYREKYMWDGKEESAEFLEVHGEGTKDGKPFKFRSIQTSM